MKNNKTTTKQKKRKKTNKLKHNTTSHQTITTTMLDDIKNLNIHTKQTQTTNNTMFNDIKNINIDENTEINLLEVCNQQNSKQHNIQIDNLNTNQNNSPAHSYSDDGFNQIFNEKQEMLEFFKDDNNINNFIDDEIYKNQTPINNTTTMLKYKRKTSQSK